MGEFGVSEKHATIRKGSSFSNKSNSNSVVVGELDETKLEAFSNKMMMMVHQNHHHRPFSHNHVADGDGYGNGPTMSFTNHHKSINNNNALASSSAIDGASAAPATPLQPFLFPPPTSSTFKSSSAGGIMGFPFTSAQWKELERQAMIYKYMMKSVPVPPDLLMIPSSSLRSPLDGGFNLRLSNGTDPEPGRCRRTDGKKWRCSRDVAPNHKYCERHMHRGRPRSRKPVEVHTNNDHQIKRARHDSNAFSASDVTLSAAISNPSNRKVGSSSSHFVGSAPPPPPAPPTGQPYLESSLSLHNFGVKGGSFDSSNKEPRGLDWMLNGDPISLGASDSQWQSLTQNKVGSSCNNTNTHYLNSYALYSSGLDIQDRSLPLFLNPLVSPMETLQSEKPRGFIDAWSNAEAGEINGNTHNKNSTPASIGKLSLSSLDLSMGGGYVHEEMGLGIMDQHGNTHNDTKISLSNWLNPTSWVASNPLAEVLRSSTVTSSNPSSPAITNVESNSPLGTMVSSPSGVLQKTLASFSDSSSNSSPTVASSRANSEIALLRSQSNVN